MKIIRKIIVIIKKKYPRVLFKLKGINYGRRLNVWGKIRVEGNPKNISIGDNCALNYGVILEAGDKITIGNNTIISAYSQIHTSYIDYKIKPYKHVRKPVIIGNNVWITSGVIINAGVKIGNNVVVAANSVVLNDLEDNGFYAGCPAILKKKI